MVFQAPERTLNAPSGARMDVSEVYRMEGKIKVYETPLKEKSQGKSVFRVTSGLNISLR